MVLLVLGKIVKIQIRRYCICRECGHRTIIVIFICQYRFRILFTHYVCTFLFTCKSKNIETHVLIQNDSLFYELHRVKIK